MNISGNSYSAARQVTSGGNRRIRSFLCFFEKGRAFLATVMLGLPAFSAPVSAETPPVDAVFQPEAVLKLMHLTNDWQKAHPRVKETDRNWERGTWYTGVMAAHKTTRDPRFLDQAMAWGQQHHWQVSPGILGGNRLFCVETWVELYLEKKDPAMIAPTIQWLATPASNSPAGAKIWYRGKGGVYADSLYGAPALAMLAQATGDRKYLAYLHPFWADVSEELFDKDDSLFYRDRSFIGKRSSGGKKIFWSRGNGWVMGGLVRVLEYLPTDDPARGQYVEQFKAMAVAVSNRQPSDGLWRCNLDDPSHFPMPESSGSGFLCYAITWGMNRGILDRITFEPVVRKAWRGLTGVVSSEGQVQYGQLVGDRPTEIKQENTHEYVTGAFLLAASEIYKLGK